MTWRRWALQQLGGLVAVVVGLVVATLTLDGGDWGLSTWLIFLGAWLAITAVQAVVRARRGPAAGDS
ncbi:MAG: hypothetical protein ACTHLJ_01745 [Angustibacter sp.]